MPWYDCASLKTPWNLMKLMSCDNRGDTRLGLGRRKERTARAICRSCSRVTTFLLRSRTEARDGPSMAMIEMQLLPVCNKQLA